MRGRWLVVLMALCFVVGAYAIYRGFKQDAACKERGGVYIRSNTGAWCVDKAALK